MEHNKEKIKNQIDILLTKLHFWEVSNFFFLENSIVGLGDLNPDFQDNREKTQLLGSWLAKF